MAKFADRVVETTQTVGTGTLDLDGAVDGFRAFADQVLTATEVYYCIEDNPADPAEWEYGKGTLTAGAPNKLSRDTVVDSSNGGNKISLADGTTYTVTGVIIASKINGGDEVPVLGTAATKNVGTAVGNVVALEDVEGDAKLPPVDGSQLTAINLVRPSFSAHKNAVDQPGITNSGDATKITFPTEEWDTDDIYDAANSRFTPPAGKWLLSAVIWLTSANDGMLTIPIILKNGVEYRRGKVEYCAGTSSMNAAVSVVVQGNASDYFEVAIALSSASASRTVSGVASFTYFQGVKVSD